MSFEIKECVALVTGANRGIGKAIVNTLIKHGAKKVYAAVRKPDSAKALVNEFGSAVEVIELDLDRVDTIEKAAVAASDVTLVINNAGVAQPADILKKEALAAFEIEHRVNVIGLMHMARCFAPILKRNGGGAFVQLNSVGSFKTFADFSTYCASKAAAYSLTQALKIKLAEQGTQVVSVHPGPIATDMAEQGGFREIAEPAELVGESIVTALKENTLHAFPDTMARQLGDAYKSFSESVIEA